MRLLSHTLGLTLLIATVAACGDDAEGDETTTEGSGAPESDGEEGAEGESEAGGGCLDWDGEEGQAVQAKDICNKILCDCGGWGWESTETCTEGFHGIDGIEAACESHEVYFICMSYCLDQNCEGFKTCEEACWEQTCRE